MNEITLVKITGWVASIAYVLSGSIYAFISNNKELNKYKAGANFLLGTYIAFIFSRGVIENFKIDPLSYIAYSIQIVCGLFIFQAIAQLFIQVPIMVAELPKALSALRKKWLGE